MRNAFIEELTKLAAADPSVFLITGDLGFGVLVDFERDFPGQFLNAGVAEQNMTTLAAGLALEGRNVFTYSIGNFPTLRCLEQIRNDVCYHEAKVTFVSVGGGFSYGALGMSHHATEDIAIMRALPNVTVLAPGSRWETRQLMPHVVAHKSPVYLRLERSGEEVPNGAGPFEFGKARVLREGTDITLISTGGVLTEVLGAAELLSVSGIEARVVSMHSVKPLDVAAIEAAATETGGIVTIEEHSIIGGLGGAVAEVSLEARWRPALFARIGLNDVYSSVVGSQEYLRRYYGMDRSAIADRTQALLGK
jgi:transketolase